jgi:hypothetical protein
MFPMLLKSLGIKIDQETVSKLESLLPTLPTKIHEAIVVINEVILEADHRTAEILNRQNEILEKLDKVLEEINGRADSSNSEPADKQPTRNDSREIRDILRG